MYERFTDRARKVMQIANESANYHGSEEVCNGHLLWALFAEGTGVAGNVLKNLNISGASILKKLPAMGDFPSLSGRRTHSKALKDTIAISMDAARELHHDYVGTEHLLLGFLKSAKVGDPALEVLTESGLTVETVEREVLNILGVSDRPAPGPDMAIDHLIRESHATALEKGWWPKGGDAERNFGEQIALIHSELSEALEQYRTFDLDPAKFLYDGELEKRTWKSKPEGIAVEFADVLIRIFDTCGRYNIPLKEALVRKMEYNKGREYRHGGKKA